MVVMISSDNTSKASLWTRTSSLPSRPANFGHGAKDDRVWTSSSPRRTTPSCSSPARGGCTSSRPTHTVAGRHSKGKPIVNLLPKLEEGEKVENNLPLDGLGEDVDLMFATRNGIVKRTALREYRNIRSNGIIAISLEEGDSLVDTKLVHKDDEIVLATRNGQAARFDASEVRSVGRPAIGVIGMRPEPGDES